MNYNKYFPICYTFLRSLTNYKNNIRSSANNLVTYEHRNYILLSSALAFLWPVKKPITAIQTEKELKLKDMLEQADQLFDNAHYEECYNLLKESEITDVEIQWRLTRAMYNMSKQAKYDNTYKKGLIYDGYKIISKALETNSDHFAVQKWYALLLDSKSNLDGIKERIKQLENVKKHMDIAVTLNPSDATTLYMLGEWCYQVSEMPWHQRKIAETFFASPPQSTYEEALEYFLRAESVQPRFYSLNLLRLGTCYSKLHKDDQAKYYLQLAASYPAKSNDDHQANKEASELLKRFK